MIIPILSFKIDVSASGKRPMVGEFRKDYDVVSAIRSLSQRYVIFFEVIYSIYA
jgi:hypothetical protein